MGLDGIGWDRSRLGGMGWDGMEWNGIGWDWIASDWIEIDRMYWIGLDRVWIATFELDSIWIGLHWIWIGLGEIIELNWIGWGWVESNRVGLDWRGSNWFGLECIRPNILDSIGSELDWNWLNRTASYRI